MQLGKCGVCGSGEQRQSGDEPQVAISRRQFQGYGEPEDVWLCRQRWEVAPERLRLHTRSPVIAAERKGVQELRRVDLMPWTLA